MNEETTVPSEMLDRLSDQPSAMEVEETDPTLVPETVTTEKSLADWFTDPTEVIEATEGISFYAPEATVAETVAPVTVEVIEAAAYDISHSVLFSGFLVCGTLVGLALLRKIYGT